MPIERDRIPGPEYAKLAVWLGDWRGEGINYDAEGRQSPWRSNEKAEWFAGKYFVVQQWAANPNAPFIGIAVIGYDSEKGRYFTRSFENHGFYRHYDMEVDGNVWTFSGPTERARVEFTNPDTQVIHWDFKPSAEWRPLCDRVARRVRSPAAS